MKKFILITLCFALFGQIAFSQSTTDIATAMDTSAKAISKVVPRKSPIAVGNFFSDSKELSSYLCDEMVKKLTQTGTMTVLERSEKNSSLINQEMEYQYSGNVSDDSMVELGYNLGAKYLVYGTFDQFGGMMQFSVQVTNVETSEIAYMTSYTISKSAKITELLGDQAQMNSVNDYLEAIARCRRKINSIEKDKDKDVQKKSSKIDAKYQDEINKINAQEKEPWESNEEYETKINDAVRGVEKKRDTELGGIDKSVGISYESQSKQVQLQMNTLIDDLQNTTFVLKGDSIQVMIGDFNAEAKPKNWPVSIKSLDSQVSYVYNGKYIVNDADVKTEYKTVEAARRDNDFSGEISYRIIEGSSKNSFNVYVVSVRMYIASTGAAIVNESINKTVGMLNANKTVKNEKLSSPSNTASSNDNASVNSYDDEDDEYYEEDEDDDYENNSVNNSTANFSSNPFENSNQSSKLFYPSLARGNLDITNGFYKYEGKVYTTLRMNGSTGVKSDADDDGWWFECRTDEDEVLNFLADGNCLNFYALGDGLTYAIYFDMPGRSNGRWTRYEFKFETKKNEVVKVSIPYSKLQWIDWSEKSNFDLSKISSFALYPVFGTAPDRVNYNLQIFNVSTSIDSNASSNNSSVNSNTTAEAKSTNPFEDSSKFYFNKAKRGDGSISNGYYKYEGQLYTMLNFSGNTGKKISGNNDWWFECTSGDKDVVNFIKKGQNISFYVYGDGKKYTVRFRSTLSNKTTDYQYTFTTKKDKVTKVTIPYSKFTWTSWSEKRPFALRAVSTVIFCPEIDYETTNAKWNLKIFDVKVY